MSIRFKFRSSVNYDTVDIDGRSSITVRELRLKIIRHKCLNVCQDFDLVFSDAVSGLEYDDENFQIPSGSSVIIKRVPAGTAHSAAVPIDAAGNFRVNGLYPKNTLNGQMEKFVGFGADLYPTHVAIPDSDLEYKKKMFGCEEKANVTGLRSECAKVQAGGCKGNIIGEERAEEQMKLEKLLCTNTAAVQNAGLPSELKCSLCNTYFKDAVMIPCCQHSFCDKCIRQVLVEKARCPKCLSDKCNVENLLPNLSLRQAIEHFLESQILLDASENAFNKYAPDGESGIQAKDASCAVTVIQREPELPHSPTATGKGSNIVLPESFYDSSLRRNEGRESLAPKMQKVKDIDGKNGIYAHCVSSEVEPKDVDLAADFQGENNFCRNNVCDEADSTCNRKREMCVDIGGGDRSSLAPGRQNKGNRSCYMCGSPGHLIRECPFSSARHLMLHTGPDLPQGGIAGYASSYWNSAVYPPFRPFPNMYGNPALMPFNASLVPVTTYGVPPCVPNMYGGLSTRGIMRSGTLLTPQVKRAEHLPVHFDVELQYAEKRRKLSNEYLGREQNDDVEDNFHDHNPYCEPERSHEYRIFNEREASWSHAEDSFGRRSCKKNHLGKHGDSDTYSFDGVHERSSRSSISGRDQKSHPSERSAADVERTHTRIDKHSKEGSKHHDRTSKRHHEKRQQSRSDSNQGRHHQSVKEANVRCRVDLDIRGTHKKHDHYTESHLEPNTSGDRRRQQKDRDCGLELRRLRNETKHKNGHPYNDRWQEMVSCSDEDRGDDYHRRKRKRVH